MTPSRKYLLGGKDFQAKARNILKPFNMGIFFLLKVIDFCCI